LLNSNNNGHFYEVTGQGQPVVLVHGLAASRRDWDFLVPDLIQAGYQCYRLDLLGHGASSKPRDVRRYTIEDLYAHMDAWLAWQDLRQPAIFIGHSMGGFLSLLYALRNPGRVESLTLVDPLFSPQQLPPMSGFLQRYPHVGAKAIQLAPEWLLHTMTGFDPATSKYFSAENRQQLVDDYKRASPNIMYLTSSFYDLSPHLAEIDHPSLVLWGLNDRTLLPESFPRLAGLLGQSWMRAIPQAGHQPHLSHPQEVNPAILNFLQAESAPRLH
jgi:pimeloyl-ACP methyl ester carboxylesterase